MLSITEQKKQLRIKMFQVRNQIDLDVKKAYDNWICMQLEKIIQERNAQFVHTYLPISTEINIAPLLEKLLIKGITVICPKTLPQRRLENRILTSFDHLETGVMNTKHPAKNEAYTGPIDFIIVPGLAFDNNNFRLGYGGGYYDNFLVNEPNAFKIGIFYPTQKVEHVPVEAHDFQLDALLYKDF